MSAPSVLIVFELEAAPRVVADWVTEDEDRRITDWLDQHEEYSQLIAEAVELAERERAA